MQTLFIVAIWTASGLVAAGLLGVVMYRRERVPAWQLLMQSALTSALLGALAWKCSSVVNTLVPAGFLLSAVPLAVHDSRTGRLPNWQMVLSYALTTIPLLVVALLDTGLQSFSRPLTAAALFLLVYVVLYMSFPGQLGGGDVKFAGVTGAVLGWQGWSTVLAGLLLIWLVAAVMYLITAVTARMRSATEQPHGPCLVIGTFIAIMAAP